MSRKERWVAALRSGKYKQGRGRLAFMGEYCCLGVLADLDGKLCYGFDGEGGEGYIEGDENEREFYGAGLDNDETQALVGKNDRYGCSFEEIADYIEKNVEVGEL